MSKCLNTSTVSKIYLSIKINASAMSRLRFLFAKKTRGVWHMEVFLTESVDMQTNAWLNTGEAHRWRPKVSAVSCAWTPRAVWAGVSLPNGYFYLSRPQTVQTCKCLVHLDLCKSRCLGPKGFCSQTSFKDSLNRARTWRPKVLPFLTPDHSGTTLSVP